MRYSGLVFFLFSLTAWAHYAVLDVPMKVFHLHEIQNNLRVEEAQAQEKLFPGKIDANTAATLAIKSFLTDGSHVESPLAIAETKETLFSHMNRYTSEISFLRFGQEAEHGETVDKFWIISLRIPTLSDHLYWAIVDRNGLLPTYNYGFN